MRRASVVFLAVVAFSVVATACKKDDVPPNVPPGANAQAGYPQQGYPQQQPGYPPQQPGYPQQQPQPGYPQQPQPGYPQAPAAGPTMAVPGPQAIACTSDAPCMSHKCNLQYGKCAFPCDTDFDCQPSFGCVKGPLGAACLPKMPGQ